MKKLYLQHKTYVLRTSIILLFMIFLSPTVSAQDTGYSSKAENCDGCYSTEIIEIGTNDDCLTINLEVSSNGNCSYALSHLMIEIPCGTVTEVYNSEGWPFEMMVVDPTTGIRGLKIDNIQNFGGNEPDTFQVSYTICDLESNCYLENQSDIMIGYKFGNCISTEIVEESQVLDLSLRSKDVNCYNGNDGAAYAEVVGGAPPFTYKWSNGSTSSEISRLSAGFYSVILTDSLGFTIEDSVEVKQPESPLNIEAEIFNASCNNSDGSINVLVTGGNPPYHYLWSNGDSIQNLTNAEKGNYVLRVKDSLGCVISKSYSVEENTTLSIRLDPDYLECHQEGQGEIRSEISGGTAPYEFAWSTGDTVQHISGVNSGIYNLTVTDSEGCTKTKSAYIGIRQLSISISTKDPDCAGGNDGEISVNAIGYGTAPFSYSWSTGDTTGMISGLESGRYQLNVTDSLGCSTSRTITLSDPPQLNFSYSISPRNCSYDSEAEIIFEGSGGSGIYEYFLGDSLVSSPLILPGNGDYQILIKDSNGCSIVENINVATSDTINIITSVTQPNCLDFYTGQAVITAEGGKAPYVYLWSDSVYGSNRNDLLPGVYSVDVTDGYGCFSSATINIEEIDAVTAKIDPPGAFSCNSNNILYSSTSNITSFSWEILSNDGSWFEIESSSNQLHYYAGMDSAIVIFTARNENGCEDSDTISLYCSLDDDDNNSNPGEGNDGKDGNDTDCLSGCWNTVIRQITPLGSNCYQIELLVESNGYCAHDLSHLVVGLNYGYVTHLSNSAGYKYELNATDPLSGIYGFKIDDISGFEKNQKELSILFEVCFSHPEKINYLPETIPVVYKAATCSHSDELNTPKISTELTGISVSAFPNPFLDEMYIKINSGKDTEVDIAIFDLKGNKVAHLYKGKISAFVQYTFPFHPSENTDQSILIYKIISSDQVIQGQLLRLK